MMKKLLVSVVSATVMIFSIGCSDNPSDAEHPAPSNDPIAPHTY